MALTFRKLHPCFAAEVSPVDLRRVSDAETLDQIRAGMDEFAVLVFRDQVWSDAEHIGFAQRLERRRPYWWESLDAPVATSGMAFHARDAC